MKALTLWQPMAWAISDFIKRIENRSWKPPKGLKDFAIHAGNHYEKDHAEQIRKAFGVEVPAREEITRGAIVAVVRLAGVIHEDDDSLGTGDLWFSGPYGWILSPVYKVPRPVRCKGMQGLWRVPDEVAKQVKEQLRAA